MEANCRLAVRDDFESLWRLVEESSAGWKTKMTPSSLREDLFGSRGLDLTALDGDAQDSSIELDTNQAVIPVPFCQAVVATAAGSSEIIGYLLFHQFYSPWKGRLAFVDYVYVTPNFRLLGVASCLMQGLKGVCKVDNIHYILLNMSLARPELKKVLARHDLHVFRDDKTDWSVFRVDFKAVPN